MVYGLGPTLQFCLGSQVGLHVCVKQDWDGRGSWKSKWEIIIIFVIGFVSPSCAKISQHLWRRPLQKYASQELFLLSFHCKYIHWKCVSRLFMHTKGRVKMIICGNQKCHRCGTLPTLWRGFNGVDVACDVAVEILIYLSRHYKWCLYNIVNHTISAFLTAYIFVLPW